ncbi:MAG: dihydropteroate synthase [Myxococcota bacterium]
MLHVPAQPLVMGILNATPDSFSDGGRFDTVDAGIQHALSMLDEGADLIDIGGESTRPGAPAVDAASEAQRVLPIIRAVLQERPRARISIDTSKATVAEAALNAGVLWVNDVTALSDPAMASVCAAARCTVVLMHMRGDPRTMQRQTAYTDLVQEVEAHLKARTTAAVDAGIDVERIVLDPGVGFGKASADNARLFHVIPRLVAQGHRVLVGASRKRFIGDLTGQSVPGERVHGSVGAALAAVALGAQIVRVHDVAATVQALTVFTAVGRAQPAVAS